MKKENSTDLLFWVSVCYLALYVGIRLSEYLASEAVVYTIPPSSENGATSDTGETVTSLAKEAVESE
jgi:hypothetical protein